MVIFFWGVYISFCFPYGGEGGEGLKEFELKLLICVTLSPFPVRTKIHFKVFPNTTWFFFNSFFYRQFITLYWNTLLARYISTLFRKKRIKMIARWVNMAKSACNIWVICDNIDSFIADMYLYRIYVWFEIYQHIYIDTLQNIKLLKTSFLH